MSDKFSVYELYVSYDVVRDELEDIRKMYELWLEAYSQTLDGPDLFPRHDAGGREIEYDEQIVAYPRVTSEDLTANHAAGLPLTRERIVRCKDCYFFLRGATPHDDDCPHFCVKHGIDMDDDGGFCSWGRRLDD